MSHFPTLNTNKLHRTCGSTHSRDIRPLQIFRSRLPKEMSHRIYVGVNEAFQMYGPLPSYDTKEARSRVIAPVSHTIPINFGICILTRSSSLLPLSHSSEAALSTSRRVWLKVCSRDGRIKHRFTALDTINVVFIEIERNLALERRAWMSRLSQVLAEAAGILKLPSCLWCKDCGFCWHA